MVDLQHVLQVLQPRLRRHRPLARALPQLLFDLAGLISGLRSLIMLDTAPGATPDMLQQALQPVAELLPDFQGYILHLDGCCYLANIKQLYQQLVGLADDTTDWPIIISFASGQAVIKQPGEYGELQQQVKVLVPALQQLIHTTDPNSTDPNSGPALSTISKQQHSKGLAAVDLGQVSGLPVMPTLNGLLLGYPVVYWVRDASEAQAASRELSTSTLQLFTVLASCEGCCCDGQRVLMSFTVPAALYTASISAKVQTVMDSMIGRAAESGGRTGDTVAQGIWSDVRLSIQAVGPQSVSL